MANSTGHPRKHRGFLLAAHGVSQLPVTYQRAKAKHPVHDVAPFDACRDASHVPVRTNPGDSEPSGTIGLLHGHVLQGEGDDAAVVLRLQLPVLNRLAAVTANRS